MLTALAIFLALLGLAAWGGYRLTRTGHPAIWAALVIAGAGLGLWMALAARATEGWAALDYVIALVFTVLPVLLGLLIGGPAGHLGRQNQRRKARRRP